MKTEVDEEREEDEEDEDEEETMITQELSKKRMK